MTKPARRRVPRPPVPALPDGLAAVVTAGGLVLLAPLEFSAGLWFGLAPFQAAMITVVIEGFTALAITTGHLVRLALVLTSASALVGMLHAAADHAGILDPGGAVTWSRFTGPDVVLVLAGAGIVTALAITALWGTHRIRQTRRAVLAAAAALDAAARAAEAVAAREHEARLFHLDAERADRDARAARAEADARRAHEETQQRARLFADAERARLDVERARVAVDAEAARAETERARADAARAATALERAETERADRARAEAERAARAPVERAAPTAPDPERAVTERAARARRSAPVDDLTERAVRRDWERAEGTPEQWTGDVLAARLGVHPATARKMAQRWREERAGARTEAAR